MAWAIPIVRTIRPIGPFCRAKTCSTAAPTFDLAPFARETLTAEGRPAASSGRSGNAGRCLRGASRSFTPVGRVGPHVARGVVLRDKVGELRSVVPGRVGCGPGADSPCRRSMATWFLYPKAGTARSMRGEPSSEGFAYENFTVQRASRSFCATFAGLSFQASGIRPARISAFSPSELRCLGAGMIVASRIRPPMARKPAFLSAASQAANSTSTAGFPPTLARVSASRKVQIVFASGIGSESPSPAETHEGEPVIDQQLGPLVRKRVARLQDH